MEVLHAYGGVWRSDGIVNFFCRLVGLNLPGNVILHVGVLLAIDIAVVIWRDFIGLFLRGSR